MARVENMKKIVDNLIKAFLEDGADESEIVFQKATEEQMQQLQDLVPMLETGVLKMSIPEKPSSKNQKYFS